MLKTLTICITVFVASSAAAQSLVGKWDCTGRDGPGLAIRTLQEYRTGGQFLHRANLAIGNRTGRMDASITLRGRWDLKSSVIVENIRSAKMTALKRNGADISRTATGRRMARTLPAQMIGRSPTSRTRIKFTNRDRFVMTGGKIRGICTRR